jgi:hypothetical protein
MDTDSATAIAVGQIITYAVPYVWAAMAAVWTAVLLPVLKKHFAHLLTNDQWANIERASKEAAAKIWAEAEPTIAAEKIQASDPRISFAVTEVSAIVRATAESLGLTPERLKEILTDKIHAHLGTMQATAGVVPVTVN